MRWPRGLLSLTFLLACSVGPLPAPDDGAAVTQGFSGVNLTFSGPQGPLLQARVAQARWDEPLLAAVSPPPAQSGSAPAATSRPSEAAPSPQPLAPDPSAPLPVQVTANRMEGSLRQGTARFEGQVQLTRGSLSLRCERLEAWSSGTPLRLVRLEAAGQVEVKDGRRRVKAERLTWDLAKDHLVVEGQPELWDGLDHLRGERLDWYLAQDRLTCVRCQLTWRGASKDGP